MMLLVLVALLAALGLAAVLGRTADSRDAEYSLGMLLRHRRPGVDDVAGPGADSAA